MGSVDSKPEPRKLQNRFKPAPRNLEGQQPRRENRRRRFWIPIRNQSINLGSHHRWWQATEPPRKSLWEEKRSRLEKTVVTSYWVDPTEAESLAHESGRGRRADREPNIASGRRKKLYHTLLWKAFDRHRKKLIHLEIRRQHPEPRDSLRNCRLRTYLQIISSPNLDLQQYNRKSDLDRCSSPNPRPTIDLLRRRNRPQLEEQEPA